MFHILHMEYIVSFTFSIWNILYVSHSPYGIYCKFHILNMEYIVSFTFFIWNILYVSHS